MRETMERNYVYISLMTTPWSLQDTAILDDDVAQLHVDMINFPITYGFASERWTRSVTPLIEKDEGMPLLTRLRVIHLFEADYNLFLKIIYGRRMVKNG
jgi:hypothetical protein